MADESILHKINALLNKTVENGATEHEANAALEMAQRLMTKHMIEESQLAEHAKDKACRKITAPIFKTGYDTTDINAGVADAFDCKCWWNRGKEEVYFFGFGDDARLAAYFYNYLNNAVVNESEKYKKSLKFIEQKMAGYHSKSILSSFRKGMIRRLNQRLGELKASRVSNVVKNTGTNLVLIKEDKIKEEYEALGLKLKKHRSSDEIQSADAFYDGSDAAEKVNMAGGIEADSHSRARISK